MIFSFILPGLFAFLRVSKLNNHVPLSPQVVTLNSTRFLIQVKCFIYKVSFIWVGSFLLLQMMMPFAQTHLWFFQVCILE